MDYIRHGNQMYGLSVQYYSSVVLVSAWTELVKNMVYFEVKYSTSVSAPGAVGTTVFFHGVASRPFCILNV